MNDQDFSGKQYELSRNLNLLSQFGKTYRALIPQTLDETLHMSSPRFMNAGRVTSAGELLTLNTSESRNAAAAVFLSQILEENVSEKYYLSQKAAQGILNRAERRGKALPPILLRALQSVGSPKTARSVAKLAQTVRVIPLDDCASSLKARDGKDATDLVAVALDVRNLKANGNLSGTLQSKPNGGYSLNYQNPIVLYYTHAYNQDRIYCIEGIAPALTAEDSHGARNIMTPIAFMAGQGAQAHSIAASETVAPTLRSAASGTNQTPTVAFQVRYYSERERMGGAPGGDSCQQIASAFGVRRLTPIENERLQGFPDGHTAVNRQSDTTRYKQLGNAVTVNVTEWLGQRIMQSLKTQSTEVADGS